MYKDLEKWIELLSFFHCQLVHINILYSFQVPYFPVLRNISLSLLSNLSFLISCLSTSRKSEQYLLLFMINFSIWNSIVQTQNTSFNSVFSWAIPAVITKCDLFQCWSHCYPPRTTSEKNKWRSCGWVKWSISFAQEILVSACHHHIDWW